MPNFDFAPSAIIDSRSYIVKGIRLVQLNGELWRVTRPDGDVLGYVESFSEPRGVRFRSKRLVPLQKQFIVRGEFWSFDDAVDCLRFG